MQLFWIGFNPDDPRAAVQQRFVDHPPPDIRAAHAIYSDNPWFPPELERERFYLKSVDLDAYAHVWEGQCRTASDAQILKGKVVVEAFAPGREWSGPYLGADWGFSVDPTVLVKCWISGKSLYVEHEAYAIGCDLDRTPALFDQVRDARRHTIRADSSRPETINFMNGHGFPEVRAAPKWPNSVEDGIAFLRSFERVVIHPRCTHTLEESRLYSFRTDRLSGDVLPEPLDRHNHCIDAIRYALTPLMKVGKMGGIIFIEQELKRARAAGLLPP
jgi:phage terminase large subunit